MSDSSNRVNRTWHGERWEGATYVTTKCTNAGALRLLLLQCVRDGIQSRGRKLQFNQWQHILHFLFGHNFFWIGQYTAAVSAPCFFKTSTCYQDPFLVVDAAMRGQEDVVLNILRADPSYLLKKAKIKNSVGVEYEVTPLQAAIMANDVQMAERMREHFPRLTRNSFNGIVEMHRHIKEIYQLSLQKYLALQKNKIAALQLQQQTSNQITKAQCQCDTYQATLQSDDINRIFEAHLLAQENNAFDFSPYVDAILKAPNAELDDVGTFIDAKTKAETDAILAQTGVASRQTDDCRKLPFDQLTLVQKLNRFREKFVEHMQQEIIFNPNHIMDGLKSNLAVWKTLPVLQDPKHYKRIAIFSQLCGWAQRNAAEPVKQDIRQGIQFLVQKKKSLNLVNLVLINTTVRLTTMVMTIVMLLEILWLMSLFAIL